MKNSSRILMMLAIAFLTFGCEQDDDDNGYNGNGNGDGPGENEVWMENIEFNPETITVSTGTTVTWTNNDDVAHTVTREGMFDSGNIAAGGTFSFTFDEAGTYDYVCTIHPAMTGTVIVE